MIQKTTAFLFFLIYFSSYSQHHELMNRLYIANQNINNLIPNKITETKSVVLYLMNGKNTKEELTKLHEKFLTTTTQTKKYLNQIFEKDFEIALEDYKKNFLEYNFNKKEEGLIIEMIFQLGLKNTANFKKFNKHLKEKKIYLAAIEMLDSLWYLQTPKRVEILMGVLLNFKNDKKKQ